MSNKKLLLFLWKIPKFGMSKYQTNISIENGLLPVSGMSRNPKWRHIHGSTKHTRLSIYLGNQHDLISCLNVFERQSTCDFTKLKCGAGWLLVLTSTGKWSSLARSLLAPSQAGSGLYRKVHLHVLLVALTVYAGKWFQAFFFFFFSELEFSLNSACGSSFTDFSLLVRVDPMFSPQTTPAIPCSCCADLSCVESEVDQSTVYGCFFTLNPS